MNLDKMPVTDAVELMLREEAKVPTALLAKRALLASAVLFVTRAIRSGGRLFYFGAGTSGRLGVLMRANVRPRSASNQHSCKASSQVEILHYATPWKARKTMQKPVHGK